MTASDNEFGKAVAHLMKTDPPRGLRWLMVGACLQFEKRLAIKGAVHRREMRAVLRELRATRRFAGVTDRDLAVRFECAWRSYKAGGGYDGWTAREQKIEEAREASEGAQ